MSFLKNRYVKWTLISMGLLVGAFALLFGKKALYIYQGMKEHNALWAQIHKERGVDNLPVTLRHEGTANACYALSLDGIDYCFPQHRFKDIDPISPRDGSTGLYVDFKSEIADPQGYGNGYILLSKRINHPEHKNNTHPEAALINMFSSNTDGKNRGNSDLIRSLTHDPVRQNKWTQIDSAFCTSWNNERCAALVKGRRIHARIRVGSSSAFKLTGDLLYQEPGSNASYKLSYGLKTGTDEDLIAATMALLEEFREIERAAIVQ